MAKEEKDQGHQKHYKPLKGRSVPFSSLSVSNPEDKKTNPEAYAKRQAELKDEHEQFKSSIKSGRTGEVRPIAEGDKFRNRHAEAGKRNEAKGTNYKGDNLAKKSSNNGNDITSHFIEEKKSGKKWGDKAVSRSQRKEQDKIHTLGNEMTQKGASPGIAGKKNAPQGQGSKGGPGKTGLKSLPRQNSPGNTAIGAKSPLGKSSSFGRGVAGTAKGAGASKPGGTSASPGKSPGSSKSR